MAILCRAETSSSCVFGAPQPASLEAATARSKSSLYCRSSSEGGAGVCADEGFGLDMVFFRIRLGLGVRRIQALWKSMPCVQRDSGAVKAAVELLRQCQFALILVFDGLRIRVGGQLSFLVGVVLGR